VRALSQILTSLATLYPEQHLNNERRPVVVYCDLSRRKNPEQQQESESAKETIAVYLILFAMRRSLEVADNVWTTFTDLIGGGSTSGTKQTTLALQQIPEPHTLSSGEIIFVTILVSIIAVAVGFAIQSILQRRREVRREKEIAAANQEIAVTTVEMGTEEKYGDNPVMIGRPSRRVSIDSSVASGRSSRSGKVYTKSGSGGYSRKDSTTSLASRVSTDYKFAAIDHMNQIAQRGRHDGL
jgi:hypothetical protein